MTNNNKWKFRLVSPLKYYNLSYEDRFYQMIFYLPILIPFVLGAIFASGDGVRFVCAGYTIYLSITWIIEQRSNYRRWKQGGLKDDQEKH